MFKNYYISLDYINSRLRDVAPNYYDFEILNKNIEVYYEFPKSNNILKKLKNNKLIKEITALKANSQSNNYLTYIKLK